MKKRQKHIEKVYKFLKQKHEEDEKENSCA